MKKTLPAMATDNTAQGLLQVNVVSIVDNSPIQNVNVRITYKGNPDSTVERVSTNSSGQTEQASLDTPPLELSLTPGIEQPYSEHNLLVTVSGYKPVEISGTEVLPGATAIQPVVMKPDEDNQPTENPIVILDHTLCGNHPLKIAESKIKLVGESGEVVLSRVVVPQMVVIHDGVPTDPTASNYYVSYWDYIKNVAPNEIYATWPRPMTTANVLAITSFILNRVYMEWCRNQGYDFTITSSTAFDHKWVYGRNIFDSTSEVADEIFDNYLPRPEVKQPTLTQYYDGRKATCPNWMTQWGSCSLGERGYSPIEILRYFYGSDMHINTTEQIFGTPASQSRYDLTIGTSGQKVQQVQEQLDTIAMVYGAIPRIAVDGFYGPDTAAAVREFQNIFGLPQTGVIDFAIWYKISYIYVGITRIAESVQHGK